MTLIWVFVCLVCVLLCWVSFIGVLHGDRFVLHGPNLGIWCGSVLMSSGAVPLWGFCVLCPVLFVFVLLSQCACPSGVSVFNFCEVGFDSLTKLVSGGPRFLVDPILWHCTLA